MSVFLSPTPPTEPSTSVDNAVVIGVVVAFVTVILLIILCLAVFVNVLVYLKRRDGSELEGCRHQDESYPNMYT